MNAEQAAPWRRRLTGPAAAVLVLALFWLGLLAGLRGKGLAYDESVHAAAGFSYWKFGDYRLNPENGNLPQRLMALPLAWKGYAFPSTQSEPWRRAEEWVIADRWFHRLGLDEAALLARGRAAAALLAVALGALVWAGARRLFGPAAGMLALVLFALNPAILANGGLMTSDTAAALFFLAAALGLGAGDAAPFPSAPGGERRGLRRAFRLEDVRAAHPADRAHPRRRPAGGRAALAGRLRTGAGADRLGRRALALAGVGLAHLVLALAVIWACYGFRYSAFSPAASGPPGAGEPALAWAEVQPASPAAARALSWARGHRVLPEAFLYGYAYSARFARSRGAFLDGRYDVRGWRGFFPYAFLVKTPLPLFGVLALAAAAAAARRRWDWPTLGGTLSLWALLGCYWTAAILSHVDIGHRHLLPIYGPIFILGGSAAAWPADPRGRSRRGAAWTLAALVALLAAETAWRFPNYLGYFNGLVRPSEGYRHLVDSSSDWGQELPALKRYIESHPSGEPRYLSYFGSGSPAYSGIPAELTNGVMPVADASTQPLYAESFAAARLEEGVADFLARHPEFDAIGAAREPPGGEVLAYFLRKPGALALRPGTYFISATLLESVKFESSRPWEPPWGPWNARYERVYQDLRRQARPLLGEEPGARAAAIAQASPAELPVLLLRVLQYDEYRFARLKAYLRRRAPDTNINFSILVYRVTAADLAAALDGPPPELGPDVAAAEEP